MNKEETERRCKYCGKLLLDGKVPFCRRCILRGRNKATQFGGLVGGLFTAAVGAHALAEDHINDQGSI